METEFKRFAILLKIYLKFSSYLFNTLHRLLVQRNCTVKGKQTELLTAIGWKVNRKLIEANLVPSTAGKHSDCTTPCLYDFVPCLSLGSVFCYWSCVQWYPRLPGHKVGYSSMFFDKMKTEKSILPKKIKQRCHRYRVSNVCCKLQMAAFQFPDGNSIFYSWKWYILISLEKL